MWPQSSTSDGFLDDLGRSAKKREDIDSYRWVFQISDHIYTDLLIANYELLMQIGPRLFCDSILNNPLVHVLILAYILNWLFIVVVFVYF